MTLHLNINGQVYEGAHTFNVERSFTSVAPTFDVTYVDRWHQDQDPWPILPGDEAELLWDDFQLVVGYINVANWDIDGTRYSLTAAGRSKTQDLIDCSATHATGQWRQKTMKQIAKDLCKPFGIEVGTLPDEFEKFELFRLEPGETVYQAIERMTRIRGYLITSHRDGNLLLVRSDVATEDFYTGYSLDPAGAISRSLSADDQDRFSEYRLSAQTAGSKEFNKAQVAKQKFSAEDSGIDRFRPMVIVGSGPGHRKELEASAQYERNVRAGRGLVVTYRFPGAESPLGVPWVPGERVSIKDPILRLNRDMIIDRVSLTGGPDTLESTIELVRPETYSVLDWIPKDRNAVG